VKEDLVEASRCGDCDPSFGCFSAAATCCKQRARVAELQHLQAENAQLRRELAAARAAIAAARALRHAWRSVPPANLYQRESRVEFDLAIADLDTISATIAESATRRAPVESSLAPEQAAGARWIERDHGEDARSPGRQAMKVISPTLVSEQDVAKLAELGFEANWDDDNFCSREHGSC